MSQTGELGFLKWIVMLVIAIILASYFFDFNVQDAVEDEQTQSNLSYIGTQLEVFYHQYLEPFLNRVWDFLSELVENASIGQDSEL